MTTITDLPLDAWVGIFKQFPLGERVNYFDTLRAAGLFIELERLDTFWTIITRLETPETEPESLFEAFPDVDSYLTAARVLEDMGVSSEIARSIVGQAQGDLQVAIDYLGW